ncbi:MAG: IS1595 family transposase, partial [Acidobacteria bacterium]|nr:IS1595 family transposase [Acidobacteriota bacterium]
MKKGKGTFDRQPNKTQPSIFEVMQKFNTEERCIKHLERIRWPEGLRCIRCDSERVMNFTATGKTGKERNLYECVDCRYQYSVTTGTVFHDTHLPLTKWFLAIYLICSAKKGISAKELQRQLATSYKTAWYMAHRVRLAMQQDDDFCQKFSGVCEVDETYVGGKRKGPRGRSTANKVPVVGIREKTSGKVVMRAVQDVQGTTLAKFIRNHAEAGAEIHTDEFSGYFWLDSSEYKHKSVKHADEYVTSEGVTTNGVEGVWSLFKRGIVGQFHKVSAKYLPLYLDEFAFRFNNRETYN